MEMLPATESGFVALAAWSAVLLVVHVVTQGTSASRELGSRWNVGPRDGGQKATGVIAGRAERASNNFRETYPAFLALCLGLALVGDTSGWGLTGALLWFVGRMVYLPLYLAGVPVFRSVAWMASLAGLLMMFIAVVFPGT